MVFPLASWDVQDISPLGDTQSVTGSITSAYNRLMLLIIHTRYGNAQWII